MNRKNETYQKIILQMLITRFLSHNFTKDSIRIFILFSTYTYVSKRAFLSSSSEPTNSFCSNAANVRCCPQIPPDKHTLWVELHQHAFCELAFCINKSDHLSPAIEKFIASPHFFKQDNAARISAGMHHFRSPGKNTSLCSAFMHGQSEARDSRKLGTESSVLDLLFDFRHIQAKLGSPSESEELKLCRKCYRV